MKRNYIISVTGFKGGVGKSTTAIHLAGYFSQFYPTLLIDGDPNRTAIDWSNRGEGLPFEILDLQDLQKNSKTKEKTTAGYKVMIIDTPARPDKDDFEELAKTHLIILPTIPDIVSFTPTARTAQSLGKHKSRCRALITMATSHKKKKTIDGQTQYLTDAEYMRLELEKMGFPIFQTNIRSTTKIREAAEEGKLAGQMDNKYLKSLWQDYANVGEEILEFLS